MRRAPSRASSGSEAPPPMAGDRTPGMLPTTPSDTSARRGPGHSFGRSVTPGFSCVSQERKQFTPPSVNGNITPTVTSGWKAELQIEDSGPDSAEISSSGPKSVPFDICLSLSKSSVKLKRSLLEVNRERRKEQSILKTAPQILHLRTGMVLLKNFIKHSDQVEFIKKCQMLGTGKGGFYVPHYKDGAKLHLQMMCLGKNWNPDLGSYEDRRSFDGSEPPAIPDDLKMWVKDALRASHDFIAQNGRSDAEEELPSMSPDICIVNFYSNSGKLGLHQDKDESRSSLTKGLPVVSFSFGDTAEFLYGDNRDIDSSSRVDLESGDVLLFGGKSRNIFHGISLIKPNTAPKRLIEETNLRPGRLNLTFRQY